MAKRYDVIVFGAGPTGFLVTKAAGENGLDVVPIERKSDPRRAYQSLSSVSDFYERLLLGKPMQIQRLG